MATAFDVFGVGPTAADAKAAGVYARNWYSSNSADKDGTKQAVDAYAAEGIYGWVNFETTTTRWQAGSAAGQADAQHAVAEYTPFGMPKGAVVVFSYDMDVDESQFALAAQYAQGACDWLHANGYLSGAYAEDALIVYLRDRGLIDVGWRSMSTAFPGGSSTTDCEIVQTGMGKIAGISIDWNTITPGCGEWLPGQLAPGTPPVPGAPSTGVDMPLLIGVSPDPTVPGGTGGEGIFLLDGGVVTHVPDGATSSALAAKLGAAVAVSPAFYAQLVAAQPVSQPDLVNSLNAALASAPQANVDQLVSEGVTDVLKDLAADLGKAAS